MQELHEITNNAARRTETKNFVHWAAECGDRPNWSKTDCKLLGMEPTSDSPESGEPTFDDSVFYIAAATRERYESESFKPFCERPSRRKLQADRDAWIKANAPGGWIDKLRIDREALLTALCAVLACAPDCDHIARKAIKQAEKEG